MAKYRVSIDRALEGLSRVNADGDPWEHGQLGYAVQALEERREIDSDVRRLGAMVSERDAEIERLRQNIDDLQTVIDVTDRAMIAEADRVVAAEARVEEWKDNAWRALALTAVASVMALGAVLSHLVW